MMLRAKSAQIRHKPIEMGVVDQELHHQTKKSNLLNGQRTQFWKHAEDIKERNKQEIERLKTQNYRLKHLRDQLMGVKKNRKNSSVQSCESNDQNYWRRQLDKEKHITLSNKKNLLNLQGILQELQDNKTGMTEEGPLVKNIRVLENRLDKVMIQYNEAQSIRKTYQQIVKRLKEERVKYDNQLSAIQRTLKGKEHDYQELLLLAHDATHAKEIAQTEFKKFESKKVSIDDLRGRYLFEKRSQLDVKKPTPMIETYKERRIQEKTMNVQVMNYKEESSFQKQQLNDYEDAYRKLKQVTGVLDSNEIIQKFKTQGLTTQSFEELKETYKSKIGNLKQEYEDLKTKLNKLKLYGEDGKITSSSGDIGRLENQVNRLRNNLQKMKTKQDRLQNIFVNVKVGTEHAAGYLQFYKTQHLMQGESAQENLLQAINQKVSSLYKMVRNDPDYDPTYFKQTPSKLEQFFHVQGHLKQLTRNVRISNQHEGSQSEEEFESSFRTDQKPKKMDYKVKR